MPPIISLNQCTPEKNRNTTIKIVKARVKEITHLFKIIFFMRELNCIIEVSITHITSIVVDDG